MLKRTRLSVESSSAKSKDQSARVEVDVGGVRYFTTFATLCSCEGMLRSMFSSRHTVVWEPDGSVFIDRNGLLFAHVLEFLRNGSRWRPPAEVDRQALCNEADFFALQPMVERLMPWQAPAVTFENARRVGSALVLDDPKREGSATFRPSDPDSFTFGIQLLTAELVWLTLIENRSQKKWSFRTDYGELRTSAGDKKLAFGRRIDACPTLRCQNVSSQIGENASIGWQVAAGDWFELTFVRGPPSRLRFAHNDLVSNEHILPSSLGAQLPVDGDYAVEVHLPARHFVLPDYDDDSFNQTRESALEINDDEQEYLNEVFVRHERVGDLASLYEVGIQRGIVEANGRLHAGAVSISAWQTQNHDE